MTRQQSNTNSDLNDWDDLFHSIKSKINQGERARSGENVTVDLVPVATQEAAESAPQSPAMARPKLGVGDVLSGRYVIESQLATGGMGTVYKALDRSRSEHQEADTHVAVKVLHEKMRSRSEVLAKLRREFYCAQALAHRSVVKVYELDLNEIPFFSMELIDGESLPSIMQRFHPMPLPTEYVWSVVREVGEGLVHAHQRCVVHGDIKPQNIMATHSGEVRILDFGAANSSPTSLTPAYASCELLEGREPDPRDDLFSFACLVYELLAGEHPFQGRRSTEARSLKLAPRRPPGLSGGQWRALQHGLAWERMNRPPSVREWLAALDIGRTPLGPIPQPRVRKVSPLTKVRAAPVAIASLAAVLLAAIAWAVLSRPKQPTLADALVPDAEVSVPAIIEPPQADLPDEPTIDEKPVEQVEAKPKPVSRPVDRTERIGVDVSSYSFGAHEKFAEIRVHRSIGSKGTTSFEWWTEAASALAGTDFAPQAPATVFFPAGKQSVSLFVKLLPNAARKRTAQFYVVLGNASSGSAISKASKATISLAPAKS
jgi:serine/threonine protein kinase